MKELRRFLPLVLILLATACASESGWRAENIPYPRTTPFDANEFARRAYLDGFRSGYRAEFGEESASPDLITPPNVQARRMGFYAGVAQARSERVGQTPR